MAKMLAHIRLLRASKLSGCSTATGAHLCTASNMPRDMLSLTSTAFVLWRYCSNTWEKMSAAPMAVCFLGRVRVSVGSQIEKAGRTAGWEQIIFCWPSRSVTTKLSLLSEPVEAMVTTRPMGYAPFSACFSPLT